MKKMSVRLCQQLCHCHKDGNLSWHFLDFLVHGRYTSPYFAIGVHLRLGDGQGRQVTLIPS